MYHVVLVLIWSSLSSFNPIVAQVHTTDVHAGTQEIQQAASHVHSSGRRELQQELGTLPSPHPSPTPNLPVLPTGPTVNSASVAAPQTVATLPPFTTPVALPDDQLAPIATPSLAEVANSTSADPPATTVPIEQAWPSSLPESSPAAPPSAVRATEAPFSAETPSATLLHHDAVPPEDDVTSTDEGETSADAAAEEQSDLAAAVLPIALSPLQEPPPPPVTLIDSVIADQIHQGHLRISVVVIIAGLMGICGLGACILFVAVRLQLVLTG